jgi:hypothetical protein
LDFHQIDELGGHQTSGNPRVNIRAPMRGNLWAINYQRENLLINYSESPHQKRQQRTKVACPIRADRQAIPVAGGSDLESGLIGKQSTDRFKVAQYSGAIELSHQSVDLDPGGHDFVISSCAEDAEDADEVSLSSLLTSLLMVEIDRKFAGLMSGMGIIRSNSDSTSNTIFTKSSEVSPTSARTSSAQIGRAMERSSNTCCTTVTTRYSGEKP